MSTPRRPRRPASGAPTRTDSFARFFVIALLALMVGAFLAWRVLTHFG